MVAAAVLAPSEAERPSGFSSLNSTAASSRDGSSTSSTSGVGGEHQQQHTASQQGSSRNHDWLNGAKTATAGGIAGAFAKSCTAPLARLTILYQVQGFASSPPSGQVGAAASTSAPPGMRQAFMQVVRREGPAALWKGNLVTIVHRLPYSSINFYTYERTQKLLRRTVPDTTDFARAWMAGATAGLVACTAAYPLDLVRTRLAAQTQGHYYSGISNTLRCIVADEGVTGLYRGLAATLVQVVPSLALNYSLYNSIRDSCVRVHQRWQQLDRQQQLASAREAAAAAAAAAEAGSSPSSSGSSSSSPAHSLAVASSVDQGLSLSQMLLWHLDDAAQEAAQTSSSGSSSEAGDMADRRSSHAEASSSGSSMLAADSSSGSRVRTADVPPGISLASGCVSGFLTATATFPLDVIRRRMQVYGRQHQGQPVSYRQIINEVTSQGRGLRGFYVGILPEYCKVVPGVAIAFCTYEQLKKWLQCD